MKIVIVEDHVMFRELVRKVCEREFGFDVIAETDSGAQALELITTRNPDLVILDLKINGEDGFEVIRRAKAMLRVRSRFLVLSAYCHAYAVYLAEKTGVDGFIDKNSNTVANLRQAIVQIQGGGRFFSELFRAVRFALLTDPKSFPKILTDQEQAVFMLVGCGFDDNEIAQRLGISGRTAKTHRSTLLHKLGVQGTPKLMALAHELGFASFQKQN